MHQPNASPNIRVIQFEDSKKKLDEVKFKETKPKKVD